MAHLRSDTCMSLNARTRVGTSSDVKTDSVSGGMGKVSSTQFWPFQRGRERR